jgi:predicted metal-dependent hydrolase
VTERLTVVDAAGRRKAYRPLPEAARASALADGLAAYEGGDFFAAHELLEPAWMGTADPAERALLQGLIKLAAAYVHGVRGNPAGIRKNLDGARSRLVEGAGASDIVGVEATRLVAEIDRRLDDLDAHPDGPTLPPPTLPRRSR